MHTMYMTNATIDYYCGKRYKNARYSDESGFFTTFNVDRKKWEREREEKAPHTLTKYIECEIKIAIVFEWPINIAYFTKH